MSEVSVESTIERLGASGLAIAVITAWLYFVCVLYGRGYFYYNGVDLAWVESGLSNLFAMAVRALLVACAVAVMGVVFAKWPNNLGKWWWVLYFFWVILVARYVSIHNPEVSVGRTSAVLNILSGILWIAMPGFWRDRARAADRMLLRIPDLQSKSELGQISAMEKKQLDRDLRSRSQWQAVWNHPVQKFVLLILFSMFVFVFAGRIGRYEAKVDWDKAVETLRDKSESVEVLIFMSDRATLVARRDVDGIRRYLKRSGSQEEYVVGDVYLLPGPKL
jgi:hypothetical protein